MLRYWPLLAIVVMLAGIIGVSQYAESAKQHCEESAKQTKAATVAKSDDGKANDNTDKPCEPPIWAKYVTFPEGVGAWAVIITLFVIAWQSIETRTAAQAAALSAQAQMDADRAWITSNAIGNPIQPLNTPNYTPGVVYRIEVGGNSPAKIVRERFRCRMVPAIARNNPIKPLLEEAPTFLSEEGMFPANVVRLAGSKYDISVNLESGPLSSVEWDDLCNGKKVLCAYGCIEYEDIFKRPRYTRVCCIYHFGLGGVFASPDGTILNSPGFRLGGPIAYNEYS